MSVFMPVKTADAVSLEMKIEEGWVEQQLPNHFNKHNGNPNVIMPEDARRITIITLGNDAKPLELELEGHHRPMARWCKPLIAEELIMFTDKISQNIKKDEETMIPTIEDHRDNLEVLKKLSQLKSLASKSINGPR